MQLTIKEFAEKQIFLKLLLVQLRLLKNIFKFTLQKNAEKRIQKHLNTIYI